MKMGKSCHFLFARVHKEVIHPDIVFTSFYDIQKDGVLGQSKDLYALTVTAFVVVALRIAHLVVNDGFVHVVFLFIFTLFYLLFCWKKKHQTNKKETSIFTDKQKGNYNSKQNKNLQ